MNRAEQEREEKSGEQKSKFRRSLERKKGTKCPPSMKMLETKNYNQINTGNKIV